MLIIAPEIQILPTTLRLRYNDDWFTDTFTAAFRRVYERLYRIVYALHNMLLAGNDTLLQKRGYFGEEFCSIHRQKFEDKKPADG